jgi:hypothetical protein
MQNNKNASPEIKKCKKNKVAGQKNGFLKSIISLSKFAETHLRASLTPKIFSRSLALAMWPLANSSPPHQNILDLPLEIASKAIPVSASPSSMLQAMLLAIRHVCSKVITAALFRLWPSG